MKRVFIIFLCLVCFAGCSNSSSNSINYVQAKEQIINNGAVLLDVRTKEEYDESHIGGAILLPLDTIDNNSVSSIVDDKSKPIIVYCKSGVRSAQAVSKLIELGYENVYDLGAMSNWKE